MKIIILGGYKKNQFTGVGKYVHDLADMLNASGHSTKVVYEQFSNHFIGRFLERFFFLPLRLRKSTKNISLTILPDESYSFLLPSIASIKRSIVIHDVRPLSLVGGGYSLLREYFLKAQNFIFLRIADLIIVPSDFTQKCVGRGIVIPNVFDISIQRHDSDLPQELLNRKYLLYVGTNQYRKNFRVANEVAQQAKEKFNLDFVCIGNVKPSSGEIYQKISNDQLAAIYQNAFALINPSLFEGFGRVAVEAQIQGCPVISTNCSALNEVLEDSALIVSDPFDNSEYLNHIQSLFDSAYRKDYIHRGFKNSQRFKMHHSMVKHLTDIFF